MDLLGVLRNYFDWSRRFFSLQRISLSGRDAKLHLPVFFSRRNSRFHFFGGQEETMIAEKSYLHVHVVLFFIKCCCVFYSIVTQRKISIRETVFCPFLKTHWFRYWMTFCEINANYLKFQRIGPPPATSHIFTSLAKNE